MDKGRLWPSLSFWPFLFGPFFLALSFWPFLFGPNIKG